MIWIFHFIIINILLFISKYKKSDKFFIVSSFVYSLFIFGQRWMTGTDFPYYLRYYMQNFENVESGYYLIQSFLTTNDLYFGILIFIILLITLFNFYRFILKVDKSVVLILYLFLISEIFFAQLSQIRQFVAVSFFVNSYFYAFHKGYIKSALNIILGLLFHTSVLYLVPFLFLRLKLNRIKTLCLLIISAGLPFFDISFILNLDIFAAYSSYLGGAFDVSLSPFHYLKFYIVLLIFGLFIWYAKKIGNTRIEQMILNGLVFNMLLYGLSFQFAPMLRASFYLKIFEIVFVAYYYKHLYNFSKYSIKTIIIILFVGIYSGLAITDPYSISVYEFRPLQIQREMTYDQFRDEINEFHEAIE